MNAQLSLQLMFCGRLLLAAFCGGFIGLEREQRTKFAGIKTHTIIAIAAALMMLISKYGFSDAIIEGMNYDISRVAAGIIAGMGILGGGVVISNKQGTVSGVTTAAGIWVTIAISMAIGAGMCVTGIIVTIMVEVVQRLLHKNSKFVHKPDHDMITFKIAGSMDRFTEIEKRLKEEGIALTGIKIVTKEPDLWQVKCQAEVDRRVSHDEIIKVLYSFPETELLEMNQN